MEDLQGAVTAIQEAPPNIYFSGKEPDKLKQLLLDHVVFNLFFFLNSFF